MSKEPSVPVSALRMNIQELSDLIEKGSVQVKIYEHNYGSLTYDVDGIDEEGLFIYSPATDGIVLGFPELKKHLKSGTIRFLIIKEFTLELD